MEACTLPAGATLQVVHCVLLWLCLASAACSTLWRAYSCLRHQGLRGYFAPFLSAHSRLNTHLMATTSEAMMLTTINALTVRHPSVRIALSARARPVFSAASLAF